ncbi:MAG: tetratricopeptide repeat protein, partial [Streptosporangiaceae bacterium]
FHPLPGRISTELAANLGSEIIAALARFREIACIPIASVMSFLPNPTPSDPIWPRLGLDFLLDGTVQQSGEQVRVIVRVLDLRTIGEVVWSGRFDRTMTTVFDLQDDIASAAVAQLEPRILLWEGERLTAIRHANPTAAELLRMAIPSLFRLDRGSFQAAGERLERALALDPDNPAIHSWMAQWHLFAIGQGLAPNAPAATHRTRELASRAIDLDPGDARALTLAGHVRGFIERRPDEALDLHDRAIEVNPNLPLAWCRSAFAHSYAGRHQEALRRAAQARQLSPEDPLAFLYEGTLAVPHLLLGEYEEAVRRGTRAIALNPGFSSSFKTQLAALGHLGRREQAEEIRARLLALEPGLSVSQALERSPIRAPQDRDRYAEGLRRGGLP